MAKGCFAGLCAVLVMTSPLSCVAGEDACAGPTDEVRISAVLDPDAKQNVALVVSNRTSDSQGKVFPVSRKRLRHLATMMESQPATRMK